MLGVILSSSSASLWLGQVIRESDPENAIVIIIKWTWLRWEVWSQDSAIDTIQIKTRNKGRGRSRPTTLYGSNCRTELCLGTLRIARVNSTVSRGVAWNLAMSSTTWRSVVAEYPSKALNSIFNIEFSGPKPRRSHSSRVDLRKIVLFS